MTLWMPNKKKPLYAPMLATFGGGSVRGFKTKPSAGGGGGGGLRLHLDGKQDISSNNLTVTDYNNDTTTYSGGPYNNGETSMNFTNGGATSGLVIPNVMSYSTASTPWCVEFWYNLTGQPSTSSPFAFNSTASGGNDMTILFGYGVGIQSIGTVGMDLYTVTYNSYPLANQWIHFCLSCDGAGRVNFWLDGQYQSTFTGVTMSDFSQSTIVVGNESDSIPISGSSNLFPGHIADVRVWDIDAYAAAGVGNFTPATNLTSHPYQTM